MPIQLPIDQRGTTDFDRLHHIYKKRRYRAHAVFALTLLLAITFVTLQTDNIVSRRILSASLRQDQFNGDLGSISPFAKKKVTSRSLGKGLTIVREYLFPLGSMSFRPQTLRRKRSRHDPLPQILLLHTRHSQTNSLHPNGTPPSRHPPSCDRVLTVDNMALLPLQRHRNRSE